PGDRHAHELGRPLLLGRSPARRPRRPRDARAARPGAGLPQVREARRPARDAPAPRARREGADAEAARGARRAAHQAARLRHVTLVLLLLTVGCGSDATPQAPPILVSGTALGAERVRLVDEERDLILTATPASTGSFSIAVAPGTATRPRLMLEG